MMLNVHGFGDGTRPREVWAFNEALVKAYSRYGTRAPGGRKNERTKCRKRHVNRKRGENTILAIRILQKVYGEHGERLVLIVTLSVPMNLYQVALIIKLHFILRKEKFRIMHAFSVYLT